MPLPFKTSDSCEENKTRVILFEKRLVIIIRLHKAFDDLLKPHVEHSPPPTGLAPSPMETHKKGTKLSGIIYFILIVEALHTKKI